MAAHFFLAVGGGIIGAAMFPSGLLAVILTSAELFTGDSLVFVASVLGGRVSFKYLVRNWTVSWIFNGLGCLFWAYFMAYLSDAIDDSGRHDLAIAVAYKKVNQTWGQILLKGIGANLMVCVSVWQATCAEEVAGKVLALWFPVTGFVAMGFDHVVANQFFIPLGMMLGADISVKTLLFEALLPATIGNVIGGGIFVGAVYWFVFDSMNATNKVMGSISTGRLPNPNDRQGQSPPPTPQRNQSGLKHRSVSVTVGNF
jgi:formate/nitrite transporter